MQFHTVPYDAGDAMQWNNMHFWPQRRSLSGNMINTKTLVSRQKIGGCKQKIVFGPKKQHLGPNNRYHLIEYPLESFKITHFGRKVARPQNGVHTHCWDVGRNDDNRRDIEECDDLDNDEGMIVFSSLIVEFSCYSWCL